MTENNEDDVCCKKTEREHRSKASGEIEAVDMATSRDDPQNLVADQLSREVNCPPRKRRPQAAREL